MRLAVTIQLVQARLLDLLAQGLRRPPLTARFRIGSWLAHRLPAVSAICAAAFLAAGCAGYRLGPVNDETAGARSVQVLPFNNQTLQPRLGDAVTQAVREQVQTDGTYHLAN